MGRILEINGREAHVIMDALASFAYEASLEVDAYDSKIYEAGFDGRKVEILKAKRQHQQELKEAADAAYDKIKRLGLAF